MAARRDRRIVREAFLLWVAALLLSLGSKELPRPDWDLAWLVTPPVGMKTLLHTRLIERTVVNPLGVLALAPFLGNVGYETGAGLPGIVVGLLLALPLLYAIAAIRTVVDTGLKVKLSAAKFRNLKAVIWVAGVACFYLAVSVGHGNGELVLRWAKLLPPTLYLAPPGLAIKVLAATGTSRAASAAALLVEVLALGGLAVNYFLAR